MEHDQLKTILLRLDEQDKLSRERLDAQYKVWQDFRNDNSKLRNDIAGLQLKIDPMYKMFENISGFNSVSVILLKGIILIGAGLGVVYGAIKYLRQ